jgi:hypothetical protein
MRFLSATTGCGLLLATGCLGACRRGGWFPRLGELGGGCDTFTDLRWPSRGLDEERPPLFEGLSGSSCRKGPTQGSSIRFQRTGPEAGLPSAPAPVLRFSFLAVRVGPR